ncbi:hypothetical protein RAS12_07185 [Achromobacter seleniivolatilans]|uniref:Uncharacterized protein n=1 Tax=Achromobacter seleniivolatilans TaxID=3047478 RepID=A0ABY9M7I3_9BURK|nr:hypothetical protein [Achromobacter sp. R39]WMD22153.1 hypothetical protein RAS12_07185 [Achromobacter sp. R39]
MSQHVDGNPNGRIKKKLTIVLDNQLVRQHDGTLVLTRNRFIAMSSIGSVSTHASNAAYSSTARQSHVNDTGNAYSEAIADADQHDAPAIPPLPPGSLSAVEDAPQEITFNFPDDHFHHSGPLKIDAQVYRLDQSKGVKIAELPEEIYQQFIARRSAYLAAMQSGLENRHRAVPSSEFLADHPAMKSYADVVVGGKVVAQIDNQGGVTMGDNIWSAQVSTLLNNPIFNESAGRSGPNSAQVRAEKIADLLGGRIVKAATAITQQQYDSLPPIPGSWIDYQALEADPDHAALQQQFLQHNNLLLERAEYLAKLKANGTTA